MYSSSCTQFVNTSITHHRKCMGKFLVGHILLVYSWVEVPFIYEFQHWRDIWFVVTRCKPHKLFYKNQCLDFQGKLVFKENECSGSLLLGINYLKIQAVNLQLICKTAGPGWHFTVVFSWISECMNNIHNYTLIDEYWCSNINDWSPIVI